MFYGEDLRGVSDENLLVKNICLPNLGDLKPLCSLSIILDFQYVNQEED